MQHQPEGLTACLALQLFELVMVDLLLLSIGLVNKHSAFRERTLGLSSVHTVHVVLR